MTHSDYKERINALTSEEVAELRAMLERGESRSRRFLVKRDEDVICHRGRGSRRIAPRVVARELLVRTPSTIDLGNAATTDAPVADSEAPARSCDEHSQLKAGADRSAVIAPDQRAERSPLHRRLGGALLVVVLTCSGLVFRDHLSRSPKPERKIGGSAPSQEASLPAVRIAPPQHSPAPVENGVRQSSIDAPEQTVVDQAAITPSHDEAGPEIASPRPAAAIANFAQVLASDSSSLSTAADALESGDFTAADVLDSLTGPGAHRARLAMDSLVSDWSGIRIAIRRSDNALVISVTGRNLTEILEACATFASGLGNESYRNWLWVLTQGYSAEELTRQLYRRAEVGGIVCETKFEPKCVQLQLIRER